MSRVTGKQACVLLALSALTLFVCQGQGCGSGPTDDCPDDPNKTAPGECGCGNPEIAGCAVDSDGDTVPDVSDGCPNDPNKTAPGTCGCGQPDVVGCGLDSDGDGTPDASDGCPNDPNKTAPGNCGCGQPEIAGCNVDSDGDGTPDGLDACPNDPNKTAPGNCGCGQPEIAGCGIDSDGDGTPDVSDGCPNDPNKTAPGNCGCGKAETPGCNDGPTIQLALGGGVTMDMIRIQAGTFMMGSPSGQGANNERPRHQVTISRPFYMGKYEVTQAQWRAVMGTNPSTFTGDNRPVDLVSWNDCQTFCEQASTTIGRTVHLPTEAQWEYACRAGTTTLYFFGDDAAQLGTYAWFVDNSGGQTHDVGGKQPNPWGLYDMYGNVGEWCQDWYAAYSSGSQTDPTGPSSGSTRVVRLGAWRDIADFCRSAYRSDFSPSGRGGDYGFRLALDPD